MLSKDILQESKQIVFERKNNAEKIAYNNLQHALSFEKYKNVFQKLKEAEILLAKNQAYNQNSNINLQSILNEEEQVLNSLNLKKQGLYPNYYCKKCNDTGYVNGEICSCLKQIINKKLLEKSKFNHNLANFENSNFDIFDDKEKMIKIYSKMQDFCNKDNKYLNVIFTGKTGVGKSYLCECMASQLIKNNKIVYFTSSFALNEFLLKFRTTFDQNRDEFLSNLIDVDYLFIDDLGSESFYKNVTEQGLFNILSERILNNKKTIITTNLDLQTIQEKYNDRIFSRLSNQNITLLIHMDNKDLRINKK